MSTVLIQLPSSVGQSGPCRDAYVLLPPRTQVSATLARLNSRYVPVSVVDVAAESNASGLKMEEDDGDLIFSIDVDDSGIVPSPSLATPNCGGFTELIDWDFFANENQHQTETCPDSDYCSETAPLSHGSAGAASWQQSPLSSSPDELQVLDGTDFPLPEEVSQFLIDCQIEFPTAVQGEPYDVKPDFNVFSGDMLSSLSPDLNPTNMDTSASVPYSPPPQQSRHRACPTLAACSTVGSHHPVHQRSKKRVLVELGDELFLSSKRCCQADVDLFSEPEPDSPSSSSLRSTEPEEPSIDDDDDDLLWHEDLASTRRVHQQIVARSRQPLTNEERRQRKRASNRDAAYRYRRKQKEKVEVNEFDFSEAVQEYRQARTAMMESKQSFELYLKLMVQMLAARRSEEKVVAKPGIIVS